MELFEILQGASLMSSDVYAAILTSQTVMGRVVDTLALVRIFGKTTREDAIRKLKTSSQIVVSDEGLVTLTVHANSRDLSCSIANTWVSTLNVFIQQGLNTYSTNSRKFIQERLVDVQQALAASADSVLSFQIKHRIASLTDETKTAIVVYVALQETLMAKQIELSSMPSATSANPINRDLIKHIQSIRKEIKGMEEDWNRGSGAGFSVPLDALPRIQSEYARLNRQVELFEALNEYLLEEYEGARIEEFRTTPMVTVVDAARAPERRLWPRRKNIVLGSATFGLFFSILSAIGAERLRTSFAKRMLR
jgi:uncharacterized protein involved in exopolysaccharide biosynthesis